MREVQISGGNANGAPLHSWETSSPSLPAQGTRVPTPGDPRLEEVNSTPSIDLFEMGSLASLKESQLCDFSLRLIETLSLPQEVKRKIRDTLLPFSEAAQEKATPQLRKLFSIAVATMPYFERYREATIGIPVGFKKEHYAMVGALYATAELVTHDPALVTEYLAFEGAPPQQLGDILKKVCDRYTAIKTASHSPLFHLLRGEMTDTNTMAETATLSGLLAPGFSLIDHMDSSKSTKQGLSSFSVPEILPPTQFRDLGFQSDITSVHWGLVRFIMPEIYDLPELRYSNREARITTETLKRYLDTTYSGNDNAVRFSSIEDLVDSAPRLRDADFILLLERLPGSVNHHGRTNYSPNFVTKSGFINSLVDKWSILWRTALYVPHQLGTLDIRPSPPTLLQRRPKIGRDIRLLWEAWTKVEVIDTPQEFLDILPRIFKWLENRLARSTLQSDFTANWSQETLGKLKKAFAETHQEKMKKFGKLGESQ